MIPKQFETKCKHFKKVLRVQAQILEYIQQIRPRTPLRITFDELCEIYPFCEDGEWVNQICQWVGDNIKDTIPGHGKQCINDKVMAQENLEKAIEEVYIYTYIFIYT